MLAYFSYSLFLVLSCEYFTTAFANLLVHKSGDDWSPFRVQESCPRFVLIKTDKQGFGDQLEHYIFFLHLSKLLRATAVTEDDVFVSSASHHIGSENYRRVAKFLGINLNINHSFVKHNYPELRHEAIDYGNVIASKNNSFGNLDCNLFITSSIYSCPEVIPHETWCSLLEDYRALKETSSLIRRSLPRKRCIAEGRGLLRKRNSLNVVWHIRTGDICLSACRLNSQNFYTKIISLIQNALDGKKLQVYFVSQSLALKGEIESFFRSFNRVVNTTLLDTVCLFLTSDILITDGSSLPVFVSAFAEPWKPIVMEMPRKEIETFHLQNRGVPRHLLREDRAILLNESGDPSYMNPFQFKNLIRSVLNLRRSLSNRIVAVDF